MCCIFWKNLEEVRERECNFAFDSVCVRLLSSSWLQFQNKFVCVCRKQPHSEDCVNNSNVTAVAVFEHGEMMLTKIGEFAQRCAACVTAKRIVYIIWFHMPKSYVIVLFDDGNDDIAYDGCFGFALEIRNRAKVLE